MQLDRESFLESEPNTTLQVYAQKHWNYPLNMQNLMIHDQSHESSTYHSGQISAAQICSLTKGPK